MATLLVRDPAAGAVGWAESGFALYVVAYLVLAPLMLKVMGVWDRRRVGLADGRELSLEIVYYDAFLPYFRSTS